MTLVMAFAFSGAFAQNFTADAGDFSEYTAGVSMVTGGQTLPFYVVPDANLHSYTTGDPTTITTGFTWNWDLTSATSVTIVGATDDDDNYVELTFPAYDDVTPANNLKTVDVQEVPPVAWGTCPGTTRTINIEIVPEPTIETFPFFETTLSIVNGGTYQYCGDQAAEDMTVNLYGYPNFSLSWTLAIEEIDVDGNPVLPNGNNSTIDNSAGTTIGAGNSTTRITADQDYVFDAGRAFELIQDNSNTYDVRTRYTYTISGVSDLISRKSEYDGSARIWYDNGGTTFTFTIIVNPQPQTGPIYHIDNNWGNL